MTTQTSSLQAKIQHAVMYARDTDHEQYPHLFKPYDPDDDTTQDDSTHTVAYTVQPSDRPSKPLDACRYVLTKGIHKVVPTDVLQAINWPGHDTVAGRRRARPVVYLHPTEWLDTETGDVIKRTEASKLGLITKSVSDRLITAMTAISRCDTDDRQFVCYILQMRNLRGGLVADIDRIVDAWLNHEMPEDLHGHRARKKRSLIQMLYDKRIMANSQSLHKDLQRLGRPSPDDILEEGAQLTAYFRRARESVASGGKRHLSEAESPVE